MVCEYEKREHGEVTGHLFYYCKHPDARPREPFCAYTLDYEKCPLLKLDKIMEVKDKYRTHLRVHSLSFLKAFEPILERS